MLKQSAIYGGASLIAALMGVAAVAAFTRIVAPAEYGEYALALGAASTVGGLMFTWLRLSVLRFQAEGTADLRLTALAGFVASALFVPVVLVAIFGRSLPNGTLVAGAIVFALAYAVFDLGQEILRARQQVVAHALATITRSVLAVVLGVAAAFSIGHGEALVLGAAAAFLIGALVQVRSAWCAPFAPLDRERLQQMIRYGAPLTVVGLATALHMTLDRFILAAVVGKAAAGQFAAIADFTRQCLVLPVMGVLSALVPAVVRAFATGGDEAARRKLIESGELLAAGVLPTAVGTMIVAPHIAMTVFGPEFRGAAEMLIPILAVAWIAHLFAHQYVHLSFHLAKKPMLLMAYSVGVVSFSAVFMVVGAQTAGLAGTATALAASEITGLALALALARRGHPLPFFGAGLMRAATATAVMAIVTLAAANALTLSPGFKALMTLALIGAVSYAAAALALNLAGVRDAVRRRLIQTQTA
jgi:O-antigen/teichoic acid export membrane protein